MRSEVSEGPDHCLSELPHVGFAIVEHGIVLRGLHVGVGRLKHLYADNRTPFRELLIQSSYHIRTTNERAELKPRPHSAASLPLDDNGALVSYDGKQ